MKKKRGPWLTRNVLSIGIVSLFTDVATEMATPFLPAFLELLGGGAMALGLLEGCADAVSSLLKLWAGRRSDRTGRRKTWVMGGYFLSSLARPFIALATLPWHVIGLRTVDRIGKGLRSGPKDALIADSVAEEQRGLAYSFNQALDHIGSVLGTLITLGLLWFFHADLRLAFGLAAIPGALTVFTIWIGIKEPKQKAKKKAVPLGRPSSRLIAVLIPLALFTLGNASDLFLLKRAGGAQISLYGIGLLWIGLHLVKAASSMPGGWLSDRLGPKGTISLAWLVYAAIYFGFGLAQTQAQILGLFLAYGLYFGLSEGAEKAWISTLVPSSQRGSAFGWYYLSVGLLTLPASLLFGWLWDFSGQATAFFTGASFALAALAALWIATALGPGL